MHSHIDLLQTFKLQSRFIERLVIATLQAINKFAYRLYLSNCLTTSPTSDAFKFTFKTGDVISYIFDEPYLQQINYYNFKYSETGNSKSKLGN